MKKEILIISDSINNKTVYTALEYSYLRAFKMKGFDCDLISFNINSYLYFALSRFYPQQLYSYLRLKQKPIINYIKKTDKNFVFVIKGLYLLPDTIDEIKSMNKIIICFYPDNPLATHPSTSNKFVGRSIEKYNAYFFWSKRLIKSVRDAGCKNVFYLPFGADTDLLYPQRLGSWNENGNIQCDVSFVGNVDKERTDFINFLSSYLGDDFSKIVFGNGWKNLNGFKVKGEVVGAKFISTILNSKINLNILRVQNQNSNNMRTFEIPAVGGFMLHEYSDEAIEFFTPGVEADFFKSVEECSDKIKFYIKNEALRQKIAEAGHQKIFSAKYLYTDRVDEIWEKVTRFAQV